MNRPRTREVLTIAEAARFLRISTAQVKKLAEAGRLPAQKIDEEWRFLKAALEQWLCGKPNPTRALLQTAGLFKGDESLREILREVYRARGRPEDGELDP